MSMRSDFRTLEQMASEYGFVFAGKTSKGHYRWAHQVTGQVTISVSKLDGDPRTIANTRRSFKRTALQGMERVAA